MEFAPRRTASPGEPTAWLKHPRFSCLRPCAVHNVVPLSLWERGPWIGNLQRFNRVMFATSLDITPSDAAERLVCAARDGDQLALGRLVQRYQRAVYATVYRRLGNDAETQKCARKCISASCGNWPTPRPAQLWRLAPLDRRRGWPSIGRCAASRWPRPATRWTPSP